MYMAEFMDHLIDVLIRQRNPLGLTYTGSFPYKLLILLRFHRISAELPDGIIIKSSHHIKGTVEDILSPDLHLDIPLILIVNIRTFQDLCHFCNFLLLPFIRIFDSNTKPRKRILLGNGKILIGKSHRIDQRIHNRSLTNQTADVFSRVHTIHHRNDHCVIRDHVPDTFAHLSQRIIFYTDKNIILLSHILNWNYPLWLCHDLTLIITVEHQAFFPDALCPGATCNHRHVRIRLRQQPSYVTTNTTNSDHCDLFLFCIHIFCFLSCCFSLRIYPPRKKCGYSRSTLTNSMDIHNPHSLPAHCIKYSHTFPESNFQ